MIKKRSLLSPLSVLEADGSHRTRSMPERRWGELP
jgi:hypothetical protein